jgi:hypothetical protein
MLSFPSEATPMTTRWPELALPDWEATRDHLRLWAQMVGKTRLALAPPVNHWWHVTLAVSARGLATGAMPTTDGRRLELELDLKSHRLLARTSDGQSESLPLAAGTVADFWGRYVELLDLLGVRPRFDSRPVEGLEAIPFEEDRHQRPYDRAWAGALFGALLESDRLLQQFRGGFIGKASPVHFFWGGFDLAATRFSGRRAPPHRGGIPNTPDRVQLEAYSHECSSAGFWPGGGGYPDAAFYSYVYPEPAGFADASDLPEGAFYSKALGEFLLPYAVVRESDDPDSLVRSFFHVTYESAAVNADWNREELERTEIPVHGGASWRTANISSGSSDRHPE